jgi:hypothetical protein
MGDAMRRRYGTFSTLATAVERLVGVLSPGRWRFSAPKEIFGWGSMGGMRESDRRGALAVQPPKRVPAKRTVAALGTKASGMTKLTSKTTKAAKKAVAKTSAAGSTKTGTAKRALTSKGSTRATASSQAATAGTSTSWQPKVRADQVVRVLGNRRAAAVLGVSESQPSRWRKAVEVPSSQVAPLLVDLDHIIARLQLIWDEDVIGDWLEGANAFLDGARPIDVLRVNGSGPVLEAIEAEAAGAYA